MVSAIIVGNSILKRAFKEDIDITPMKLQKIIYFVYARYFELTNKSLFNERFEPWKYGPVIRSVYDEFKYKGSNAIKKYALDEEGNALIVKESSSAKFKEALDLVWEKYKDYDGIVLSSLTHKTDTAWRKAIDEGKCYLSDNDILEEAKNIFHG